MQRVTKLEMTTTEVKQRIHECDARIADLLQDDNHVIQEGNKRQLQDRDDYTENNNENFAKTFGEVILNAKISEADEDFTPDTFNDTCMNKEKALASGANEVHFGRVTKRLRDADGRPIGTANDNPLLGTREYAVEFRDGHVESVFAR